MADQQPRLEHLTPPSRLRRGGSIVRGRIEIEELRSPNSDAFKALYQLYETVFPMPDEREPPEAFGEILAMNQNLDIQQKYGPYRETVALVRLWRGGPVVGGHIFGVTTSDDHIAAGYQASVQAIYTFLHKNYRGILPMSGFIDYSRANASETFPSRAASARTGRAARCGRRSTNSAPATGCAATIPIAPERKTRHDARDPALGH